MLAAEATHIVTRTELDIREGQWRELLEVVSLAVEAMDEIKVAHRDQALGALGDLHKRQLRAHARELLLRRWPAVHVLATAGVAADHYAHGTFWPKLASLLGVRNEQSFQREWGDAFLANLRRLDLPTFDQGDGETGSKYVGRILMHAGMPTYCLQDFFKIVSYKRSVVPGLTPETFVSWAATRAASAGLQDVDKPVQRFLRFGQEFAVDVPTAPSTFLMPWLQEVAARMCRYQSASASPRRDSTNDVGLRRFRLESLATHPVHLSQGLPSTPSDKLSFSVSRPLGMLRTGRPSGW